MILSLFKKDRQRESARALYISTMEQSRRPEFYTAYNVPDTLDGRFDMMTLHVYLVMRALKRGANKQGRVEECRSMSQKLFEVMFRNLDDTLRQMGVGDLSVSKKIRPMAEAFYGRVGAYEAALGGSGIHGGDLKAGAPEEMPGELPEEKTGVTSKSGEPVGKLLAQALLRNVYAHDPAERIDAGLVAQADALAAYVVRCEADLASQPLGRLLTGIVTFIVPDPQQPPLTSSDPLSKQEQSP